MKIPTQHRIKENQGDFYIKNKLPITMGANLDDIITVYAFICNLSKPLCKP